jgi:hypothetical protein
MLKYVFPAALIILDIGAAIVYGCQLDWRRCVYWIAAAVLTAAITF